MESVVGPNLVLLSLILNSLHTESVSIYLQFQMTLLHRKNAVVVSWQVFVVVFFFDEPKLHRRYLQSSCTIFKGLAISVDYPPLGFATANIEQVYDRQRKSESGRGQEIEDAQIWPH